MAGCIGFNLRLSSLFALVSSKGKTILPVERWICQEEEIYRKGQLLHNRKAVYLCKNSKVVKAETMMRFEM